MKILIACDSFKDALDAPSVCRAIERGLKMADTEFQTQIFPLADGGEGMSEILDYHLGLEPVLIEVHDPLFRKIKAAYHIHTESSTAFIEMAQAAGLPLLQLHERDPLSTTTFGVGEMIKDALDKGIKKIVLGIGGSATNDVGIGMAAALGWQFLDEKEAVLTPTGGSLSAIKTVKKPPQTTLDAIQNTAFEIICDVTNPLYGAQGAAYVYARQKGATDEMIVALDKGLRHFFSIAVAQKPYLQHDMAGAGAAGGLGFGAIYFLNAQLKRGIEAIMDLTQFDSQVTWADIILTGEGRLDSQTAHGKLIAGIIARSQQKPVIALCGAVEAPPQYLKDLGLTAAFSITPKPCSLLEALVETETNLEMMGFNFGRVLFV